MSMVAYFRPVADKPTEAFASNSEEFMEFLYPPEGADDLADLDKAWHGIAFLLSGKAGPDENSQLQDPIFGGEPVGEDLGYGPVRYLSVLETATIAKSLENLAESDLRARFDPKEMQNQQIYPDIWDEDDEALDYLMQYYVNLKKVYLTALEENKGMLLWIG